MCRTQERPVLVLQLLFKPLHGLSRPWHFGATLDPHAVPAMTGASSEVVAPHNLSTGSHTPLDQACRRFPLNLEEFGDVDKFDRTHQGTKEAAYLQCSKLQRSIEHQA
eukprot:6478796-Amphidinium_carterae.1